MPPPAPWICTTCLRALRQPLTRRLVRQVTTAATGDGRLAPALLTRAQNLSAEYAKLQSTLEKSFSQAAAKRAGEISPVASALAAYNTSRSSIADLTSLLADPDSDAELASIARDELATEQEKLVTLEKELGRSLAPKDQFDELPCMIEFRPGPGGTESRYFTDTLFHMYQSLCQRRGMRTNVLKYESADSVGDTKSAEGELPLQEAVLEILDPGAYAQFRTEAGMHRVQRVPSTEAKGRVHTSVAALWVLPLFPESGAGSIDPDDPESEFYIDPSEVKVETMRARGAGGQHVNKTESAIRITHIPTGEAVSMQDHRSQGRNRQEAWKILRSRIADKRREQREAEAAQLRDSVLTVKQIHRGEKIRTYNYNQDRCTDHRAGFDTNNLRDVLGGGESLDKVMAASREWMLQRDIEMLTLEEEAKQKQQQKQQRK